MTILEHIKKEFAGMKGKPPKEFLAYCWEYYKWPILSVLLVIVLCVQGIIGLKNHREVVFSGLMLNAKLGVNDEVFLQDFYELTGIDPEKEMAGFYTDIVLTDEPSDHNFEAFQRIMAGISVKDTDFIIGPAAPFRFCAYNSNNLLRDLRTYLDEDLLAQYEDQIYYIDMAIIELLNAPVGEHINTNAIVYPDPHKPEKMEKPVPVAIAVTDCKHLQHAYYLNKPVLYLGMVANTTRQEMVVQLFDYLLPTKEEP